MNEAKLIQEILAAESRIAAAGRVTMSALRDRLEAVYSTRAIFRIQPDKAQKAGEETAYHLTEYGMKEYLLYLHAVEGAPKKRVCMTCGNRVMYGAAEKASHAFI
jgi:hypothetical protein